MPKDVQFDPGFIKHMSAFVPNIKRAYETLMFTKDFNRRKQIFKMYLPRIHSLIKIYLGFYTGCILWAMYIKEFKNLPLINNLCYGIDYDEKEALSEVDFVIKYTTEQLPKDIKYYTGQNFSLDTLSLSILEAYREFLKVNKGFTETKTTDDIKIPDSFKIPKKLTTEVKKAIDKAVETGKLYELYDYAQRII